MAKLLLKGEDRKSSKSTENSESKVGLLIDWLQMLDPELVQASSDIRLRLLFSKMDKQTSAAATKHLRFYSAFSYFIWRHDIRHNDIHSIQWLLSA
jgi:hypothetical protein